MDVPLPLKFKDVHFCRGPACVCGGGALRLVSLGGDVKFMDAEMDALSTASTSS